jgi:hypothetical protein
VRALAHLAFLGLSIGSAAHATGMFLDAALAGDAPVVASAERAAGTGLGDLLGSVGFQGVPETLDAWSTAEAGEALPPEASGFGAADAGAPAAPPPPACSDSLDNDGDDRTDFPDDPGCLTAGSVTEQPRCQDGIDTDGDGAIDFDGGASLNGGVPIAAPDPQCEGAPWRYVERP